MSLRWFDGFDYSITADLTSQYNIAGSAWRIVAAIGRFGSGALRNIVAGGGDIVSKFLTAQGTWIVGSAYKFTIGGKATTIYSLQSDTTAVADVRMSSGNLIQITRNGTVLATGTNALLANTFYFIEFKAVLGSGNLTVKVNGITEASVTGATVGATTANRVNLHYDQFELQNTYDDYYICDGQGSVNNDFLGDMRVEALVVSAVGTYQEWSVTGGGGSHVTAVSEASPDGDTSYVASSTLNQRETYNFPDLSSVPTLIAGVKLTGIVRKDDAGIRGIKPMFRISTTDYLGTEMGVGDSYGYLASIFETNPATSAAWTGSDVNALEAGFKLTT
jgi:hypothetical protein